MEGIGYFLQGDETVAPSGDLAVVLRGGSNYDRILEAYEVWKNGAAPTILIPQSLRDREPEVLREKGVSFPSSRQIVLRDILDQLGVSKEDILLDNQPPGGGTVGEAKRIRRFLSDHPEYKKIMVITSWYHTRRTKMVYARIFNDTEIQVSVIPSLSHSQYNADNWWHFRYQVVTVFEEYLKLMMDPFHNRFSFVDG